MLNVLKEAPESFLTFSCITRQFYLVSTQGDGIDIRVVPADYVEASGKLLVTSIFYFNRN